MSTGILKKSKNFLFFILISKTEFNNFHFKMKWNEMKWNEIK